jgi:uncharacterized protein (DUF1697 family)
MTTFIALLRAINVGGTGKISMRELVALCEKAGFRDVRTYIQSGNLVLQSELTEAKVKAKLERALSAKLGKPYQVMLRSEAQLRAALAKHPFPKAEPNRVIVIFLDEAPAKNVLDGVKNPGREQNEVRGRDVFVHYPDGMGQSKLRLPFTKEGTGRNLNTVRKLLAMAEEHGQ